LTQTLNQLTAVPTIEAAEVVTLDLLSHSSSPSQLDEIIVYREIIISSWYLFWLMSSVLLTTLIGFQSTFLILAIILLILTLTFNPKTI
jgi:hypothetical protein